mmetsp:Transcript_10198/g.12921  ORF Transcript_10198/g.12921 Transcript_10198/m.12921 type:complete len:80 (-) Transcript_10198:703-942(-)
MGECVLYFNLSDMRLINLVTQNTTKSSYAISFCERKTICQRVIMMHFIDPFVDENIVQCNMCKNVAKPVAFCDVCHTGT